MAESFVQGGNSSGPAQVATFVDTAGNQTILVSLVDGITSGGHAQDVIGPLTEAAPGTDTASSGLNGRLQRIAQNTTLLRNGLPITPISSGALEGSHVLKASAGSLYSLYCLANSVDGYLMTFNATSAPVDGAVTPVDCIKVGAGQVASLEFGAFPDAYSTGIVAVFSTTGPFTKTISATAFFKGRVI